MEWWIEVVCVEGGDPIYSSRGRFPPNTHMEGDQVPWQLLLPEMHLDTLQARFGRPHLSAYQKRMRTRGTKEGRPNLA